MALKVPGTTGNQLGNVFACRHPALASQRANNS
jgi:hypothetical protein